MPRYENIKKVLVIGSGGIVIAQVKRLAQAKSLSGKLVKVPHTMVDHIVVHPNQWQSVESEYNPAYSGEVSDLLAADASDVRGLFDVAVGGLLATVRAALPDLQKTKGAVLVANGGFGNLDPMTDAYVVKMGAMGLALSDATKDKLVGILSERLKRDGVYVGEVIVVGPVKGTASEKSGVGKEIGPTIEPARIASTFWRLLERRDEIRARVTP